MLALIIISVLLSVALIWAINKLARSEFWGIAGAAMLALGVAILPFFFFCDFFPALTLQSALTFLLLLACGVFRLKPRLAFPMSIGAMAVSYGFFMVSGLIEIRELSKLRGEYPLESLSDRLQYEARATDESSRGESASEPLNLSPKVEQSLGYTEQLFDRSNQRWRHDRRTMLASLHTRKSDEFAIAQGFGQARMMPGFVSATVIELPDAEPIAVPANVDPPYDSEPESSGAVAVVDLPDRLQPSEDQMVSMHELSLRDFLDPDRIGYVQDRDHVSGFVSHRFTKMPDPFVPEGAPIASWKFARLELVSLLKHDTPVAYVSKNLPQMDELRDASTRPLENFERLSIDRLRTDEDVVIDEGPDRIRMVGSLRAAKNCLDCHSVQRGKLLGALTYELVPVRPARKKGPPVSQPSS